MQGKKKKVATNMNVAFRGAPRTKALRLTPSQLLSTDIIRRVGEKVKQF